jgi:hypothetical protein
MSFFRANLIGLKADRDKKEIGARYSKTDWVYILVLLKMPFSNQNHIQHEICMFVTTSSNELAGVSSPFFIITLPGFSHVPASMQQQPQLLCLLKFSTSTAVPVCERYDSTIYSTRAQAMHSSDSSIPHTKFSTLINVAGRHRYLTFFAGPWFGQKSKT